MKIRNGFVSNSSSSSFIIKGTEIKEKDLAKLWNIDENSDDLFDELYHYANDNKLSIETTRDFFDGEDTGSVIIGVSVGSPDDGVVTKIDKINDNEVIDILKKNKIIIDNVDIYIQFISNDNY